MRVTFDTTLIRTEIGDVRLLNLCQHLAKMNSIAVIIKHEDLSTDKGIGEACEKIHSLKVGDMTMH